MKKDNILLLNQDLSLTNLLTIFKERVSLESSKSIVYRIESGVSPLNDFEHFKLHLIAICKYGTYEKNITLSAIYMAEAPFFILYNSFEFDNITNFINRIKLTNLHKFIEGNNKKPIDAFITESEE